MVMVIPFSQRCEGWHGRSGSERRAVWVVRATRTNHPNSETGRAVFQCAAGRSRSTTSCNVTDSKSARTRQHSRSYLGPAVKRWTLREVSMYGASAETREMGDRDPGVGQGELPM